MKKRKFLKNTFLVLSLLAWLLIPGKLMAQSLTLSPSSLEVKKDEEFEASIFVDTEGKDIAVIDVVLKFDQEKLELKEISKAGDVELSQVDEKHFMVIPSDYETFSGSLKLADLKFKAKKEGETTIGFDFTPGDNSDTNFFNKDDEDLLASVSPLDLTILSAQIEVPEEIEQIKLKNPLKAETIPEFIQYLINLLFYIALALAPLMFIIGGYYYLTAAGNPDRIKTGRNILIYTAAGIGIMLLAKALISMIIAALGG